MPDSSHGPPTTRWSCVLAGRDPGDSRFQEAWSHLFETYRPVIAGFFRRSVRDAATAEEWTDEFLAAWLEGSLDRADPERGSFRRYLLRSLSHFRGKARRRAKRRRWFGLFGREPEPADTDDAPFERDFARCVLARSLEQLRRYQRLRREKDPAHRSYDLLHAAYLADDAGQRSHAALAAHFGLGTKAFERGLARVRQRLQELILQELRETVEEPGELRLEIEALLRHGGAVLQELDLAP